MARYSYEEALKNDDLRLDGNLLLAYTKSNSYEGIYEGYQDYRVVEKDGEYTVAPVNDLGAPVVFTDQDKVFIYLKDKNAYEGTVWRSNELLGEDKAKELLRAFKVFAHNHYSFGGWYPYIELLEDVYAESTEPKPIGQAVIGEDLIIS